jgi:type I restriction-modification system DNA methylase subunit
MRRCTRYRLNAFNGGLFQRNETLHSLRVPNDVFCESSQGDTEANLRSIPNNLLYLSAAYNFAAKSDGSKSLGLYTLGRIFEQSITELEIRAAEVDGRPSIGTVTKRKRDGVYYTPEWVVATIVDETLGRRLDELKVESGWLASMNQRAEVEAIGRYLERVKQLTVLDPACGSGAFLITALGRLVQEIEAGHARLLELGRPFKIAEQELVRDILARNLYGVDINGASVEIAQLALWLHTARPDAPLSMLEGAIRCGNSLVDDNFYLQQDLLQYTEEERERVNTFNWQQAFHDVMNAGGFDVVVGNTPYVKLQNFRRVHPDVAEYLREGRQGRSYYESTQTGNFDIYLAFIERAISLLNEDGRMGFIAPSMWTKNEYGAGLRRLVHRGRHLVH